MARATQNKLYRTFVKGLISEAGYLTYPEDASYAENNTVLSRKGNRTRREGINFEDDFQYQSILANPDDAVNEFVWKAPKNKPEINLLVVQTGSTIRFFDMAGSAISPNIKSYSIDLSAFAMTGKTVSDIRTVPCEFASGKGYLFIANKYVEPLLVEYNDVADTITTTAITVLVRDFEGLEDGLLNDDEPVVLTKEHHYNLQNQGWVPAQSGSSRIGSYTTLAGYTWTNQFGGVLPYPAFDNYAYGFTDSIGSGPIFQFHTKLGRYPGNNKQWWAARAEADDSAKGIKAGDFLPDVLDKLYNGNSRAPRGHYILEAFKRDRTFVSGISDIPVVDAGERPSSICFFSGRVWYACNSTIYYSQIIDSKSKVGLCYQEADPTSEAISDLIASDGGEIPIPEIDKIIKILPVAEGVMVFAMNGVWFIRGGQGGFSATDISVDKVSAIGTRSPRTIVAVDTSVFWWSEIGIQALAQQGGAFGPIPGKFGNENISEQTIQTLYNNIPQNGKNNAKGCYDPKNNLIQWIYEDDSTSTYVNRYTNVLLYDITLQAFYPWSFESFTVDGPKVGGVFLDIDFLTSQAEETVVNVGDVVTDLSVTVVTSSYTLINKPTNLMYVTVVDNNKITFSKVNNFEYVDWESFDGVGLPYESFVETGYEIFNDSMRKKQATYIFCHFRRTEDDPSNPPSSCFLRVKWDWTANTQSNKWSPAFQAYRTPVFLKASTADTGAGMPVVTSKNKVRGSGRAIQFRFGTDERGKNFDLLGWSIAAVGNTNP